MVRRRRLCYTGVFETMNVLVVTGQSSEDDIIPGADKTYLALNNLRSLSTVKMDHLRQMYTKFVPTERHLSFL